MTIELYIKTNRNPGRQKAAAAKWGIVAYNAKGQVQDSRQGAVVIPQSTGHKAALIALRDALKRFDRAAVIKIYVSDPFIRNMLINNMPYRWSLNGWHKFRYGRELKHMELWQEVNELLKKHAVKYASPEELAANTNMNKMEVK